MEYRLVNDLGDYRAYEEAKARGDDVYLMKLGKGPLVIANMPEEPKDRWRRPDDAESSARP